MFAKWFAAGTLILVLGAFAPGRSRPNIKVRRPNHLPTAPRPHKDNRLRRKRRMPIHPLGVRRRRCHATRPAAASRSDRSRRWAMARLRM